MQILIVPQLYLFFLRNREHTQYAQVMGLLLSCLPRRQENRNDREWAGCPSQPAEPRCERSFRVVMLSCRPQASVAPFSRVLPLELLWRRGALPPHFSCHYQLSCSLLLLSPWLMPAVASKILSWSSLHHCSSKQCLSVGETRCFQTSSQKKLQRVPPSAILVHLRGGFERE